MRRSPYPQPCMRVYANELTIATISFSYFIICDYCNSKIQFAHFFWLIVETFHKQDSKKNPIKIGAKIENLLTFNFSYFYSFSLPLFHRNCLQIFECLLFETDDLIMRKNEKHVILCLLEVARRGAKFGKEKFLSLMMFFIYFSN